MDSNQPLPAPAVDVPHISPFSSIALAFSGGGFRASAYALGVLSLFNAINNQRSGKTLLQHVKYISAASGGTITSAMYALESTRANFNFDHFYQSLTSLHQGDDLLKQALEILTEDKYWNNGTHCKTRNLINAFAIAYDQPGVFNGAVFGDLESNGEQQYHHLEEVCFNSTDLFKGITFRQQMCVNSKLRSRMYFGNNYLRLDKKLARNIKLADALAASSCFPGGFEPMVFPGDFAANQARANELMEYPIDTLVKGSAVATDEEIASLRDNGFALMDGGITDNQGLLSLMAADKRRMERKKSPKGIYQRFDLILVNDVGSHYMDAYKAPNTKGSGLGSMLTLKRVFWSLISIATLATIGLLVHYFLPSDIAKVAVLFVSALLFGSSITALGVGYFMYQQIDDNGLGLDKNFSADIKLDLKGYFSKVKLHVLASLLSARFSSVMSLNMDVFLKASRRLIYESFYNSANWKDRGKGNHIYDLSTTNTKRVNKDLQELPEDARKILRPKKDIMRTAQEAFEMPTTLWFDKDHQKNNSFDKVVATGQFTTCYNLMLYIFRLKRTELWETFSVEEQNDIDSIMGQLTVLWIKFRSDPQHLHNTYSQCNASV